METSLSGKTELRYCVAEDPAGTIVVLPGSYSGIANRITASKPSGWMVIRWFTVYEGLEREVRSAAYSFGRRHAAQTEKSFKDDEETPQEREERLKRMGSSPLPDALRDLAGTKLRRTLLKRRPQKVKPDVQLPRETMNE